ncbi:hypothetical protein EV1_009266 [Malus domestica]
MHQSHPFNCKLDGQKTITRVLTATEAALAAVALDPSPQDSGLVEMGTDVGEDDDPRSYQRPRKGAVESARKKNLKKQQNCREGRRRIEEEEVAPEPHRKKKKKGVGGGSGAFGQKEFEEDPIPGNSLKMNAETDFEIFLLLLTKVVSVKTITSLHILFI